MAYARKKKFWAPGHGNLHLSLESYTLCKDGNWHLLDTYNQKQPPFVMPLQVGRQPHADSQMHLRPPCRCNDAGQLVSLLWCSRGAPVYVVPNSASGYT